MLKQFYALGIHVDGLGAIVEMKIIPTEFEDF